MTNQESRSKGIKERLLRMWGRICPVCNMGKLRPESDWGRRLMQRRNDCPACQAYRRAFAQDDEEEEAGK